MPYTIYKYTNTLNGKVYIGQTRTSLEYRAQANGRNYRESRRFYKAIQEYSWDSFVPEILEVVETVEEANIKEQYYISQYRSSDIEYGYNIALGGDNHEMSPESKRIISEKAKERYKDKTANPMYGKKHTQETIQKQSACKAGKNNPMYGTKWNENQRLKCGTKGKRLNLTDEQRQALAEKARNIGKTVGLKPVRCVEDDLYFKSIVDAATHYGVSKSTLTGHLRGCQKTCRGKHFEYINNLEGQTTIEQDCIAS